MFFFKVIIRKKYEIIQRLIPTNNIYPKKNALGLMEKRRHIYAQRSQKERNENRMYTKENNNKNNNDYFFLLFLYFSTNEMVMNVDDQRLLLPMVYDILGLNEHELMPNMLHNNIVNMLHLHKKMEQIFHHIVHQHIHRIIDHQVHMV